MVVDGAAGLARRGEGKAVFHGDLVGVGLHRDLHGLARMGQPDLDPPATDHDRAADDTRRRMVSGAGSCGGPAVYPQADRWVGMAAPGGDDAYIGLA